jgi:CRP-like cAMP-binding protein
MALSVYLTLDMAFNFEHYRLRSVSFTSMLTPKEAAFVNAHAVTREYRKGQLLFREGTFSRGIYILRKGRVKIHHCNTDGKLSIIYIYQKPDFFGYRPLLADEPHPVTATAMENVSLTFIPKRIFDSLLERSHTFTKKLLTSLASEFTVWTHKIAVFSQFPVRKRVALALLILSNIESLGQIKARQASLQIGRDDFAGFVGTAKETLVRTLRHFKEQGTIATAGKRIIILNAAALAEELNAMG